MADLCKTTVYLITKHYILEMNETQWYMITIIPRKLHKKVQRCSNAVYIHMSKAMKMA